MKQLLYKSIKMTIGVILAIIIADLWHLQFTTTAGVITMLSILDTRKQTLVIGLKRIGIGTSAVLISSVLFNVFGHHILTLTLFLLILIPMLFMIKSRESLAISTVLVTHIYTINDVTSSIMLNEVFILLIGVVLAWALNIHVLNIESDIKLAQTKTEDLIKEILDKMQYELLNECDLCQEDVLLEVLDQTLSHGMDLSIEHNNNFLVKDMTYYIHYFQMRRQQFLLLKNMQKYFDIVFVLEDLVKPLSSFTSRLSKELNEGNGGEDLLDELNIILDYYREQDLPRTREEFENRAILFLYLNDIKHFVEIKNKFMENYGGIKYYGE